MTDDEFMDIFDALTEQNKVILLDLMDKLLTEQLGEQVAEYACIAPFVYGDEQSALQHILQQTCGLKADRFSAGVGTRNEQYASVAFECNVETRHFSAMFLQ